MPGTLFVVATPIGNLEDLTFRALRTLREVDVIAAEDTRRTAKLLAHYEVRKPLVSLREHNEAKQGARLVEDLERGRQVALVTDAGTPGIADPGTRFVRLVRNRHIKVVPIPGCSAITAALSASGVDADEFVFAGFAPSGKRVVDWSNDLLSDPRTVVFFATPHNIINTLSSIDVESVKRPIVVWRELTKSFEESTETLGGERLKSPTPRGEFTVVLGPIDDSRESTPVSAEIGREALALLGYLTKYPHLEEPIAVEMVASRFNVTSSVARKAIKRQRILVKQQNTAGD